MNFDDFSVFPAFSNLGLWQFDHFELKTLFGRLSRLLALDPGWEDAYRIQMLAHLAQGNRALALRTYQLCVEVLDREFGVEPLPETRVLHEAIRQKR